jgi:hypothetical protein
MRALDMPGDTIPHDVEAMAASYRSLLADRRMLVCWTTPPLPTKSGPYCPTLQSVWSW